MCGGRAPVSQETLCRGGVWTSDMFHVFIVRAPYFFPQSANHSPSNLFLCWWRHIYENFRSPDLNSIREYAPHPPPPHFCWDLKKFRVIQKLWDLEKLRAPPRRELVRSMYLPMFILWITLSISMLRLFDLARCSSTPSGCGRNCWKPWFYRSKGKKVSIVVSVAVCFR